MKRDVNELLAMAMSSGDDELSKMCVRALSYDLCYSDSSVPVSADELGVDLVTYVKAVCESLDLPEFDEDVLVNGVSVYAVRS